MILYAHMQIRTAVKDLPNETTFHAAPRPYINHSVSFKTQVTAKERAKLLEKVGLNVFYFPAEFVSGCDMLSDSGTTTMTDKQWAALHMGDEAYGSNKGYFKLLEEISNIFGSEFVADTSKEKPSVFIFHQGRSGEHALFGILGRLGKNQIIPSNGHFDTTQANIEANSIKAVNLFSPSLRDQDSAERFKGNMDTVRLEKLLKKSSKHIPIVYLTITNNTGGGQPVSMKNIQEVSRIASKYKKPLMIDACRFAENAWFIKNFEEGYRTRTITSIVKEMFLYADGFSISFKKDGLANMGGGVILKKNGLLTKLYPNTPDALMNHQIISEGHPTYGGMSGRDIMALVTGLKTVITEEFLTHRILQVQRFGEELVKRNLPVLTPFGGHAVYLDMNKFFEDTDMAPGDFGGISFCALLLAQYGHRACELGNFAFGSYNEKTKKDEFPEVNFVRFAIPRLRYESDDLLHVVESVEALYNSRDRIPGIEVLYGRQLPLRHFKARFALRK